MVLSRRAEDGALAGSSSLPFDGSANMDVGKFFFVYDNVTMRGKTDEEKAQDLLCYLQKDAFDFYYETFANDGSLLEAAKDYGNVKDSLVECFATPRAPEDIIRSAIAARLNDQYLIGSLREMDRCFEKAGFNAEASFGLLRNAVVQIPDLVQFAVYRETTTYEDLKNAVRDFVAGRTVFFSSQANNASEQGVGSKKILKKPDALERKVDTLADQLAQLLLLVKNSQITTGSWPPIAARVWSYCKKPGHGANRCDVKPYRDHKCPRCAKFGQSETSCWMKITPDMTRKVGFGVASCKSEKEKRLSPGDSQTSPDQVTVVTEQGGDDIVAAAKRNAAGEALPKQAKTRSSMQIPSLLNPTPTLAPMQVGRAPVPQMVTRPRRQKQNKNAKSNARKLAIPEHVGKYDVLAELARAAFGLTFGQLIRGDAEAAKVEIRKVLSKTARAGRSVIAQVAGGLHHLLLKVVSVKVYGTYAQALLDSGAVPNLMSASLSDVLSLSPQPTKKRITVAEGSNAVVRGSLAGIPVSFGTLAVHLDFLVVEGTPVDIIIGCPALEMLQARLDMGEQRVTISVGDESVQMGFEQDLARLRAVENDTDSEDFTYASESENSDAESEEDDLVVALLDEEPFEPESVSERQCPVGTHDEGERRAASLLEKFGHLSNDMQEELIAKLQDSGTLARTLDDLRPADVPVEHEFKLSDNTPIHVSPRRLPPRHSEVVRQELDKKLAAGIITPSASPWSFPVVIASKKDGKPRFCVDYRSLNRRMKADRWPLPKIEEIFDDLE